MQIYPICDMQTLITKGISLGDFLNLLLNLDIVYIQYRDKVSDIETQKNNLLFLKSHTKIPIIINDNIELLEFADGVHLGQEDLIRVRDDQFKIKNNLLLLNFLRKKYPNKIFGLSTHNELEILEANTLPLDYVGLGAYKTTNTKDVSTILGNKISYLAKISKHPVGAIGGVKIKDKIENIAYNVVSGDLYEN
ncbi:MAG: thiamine phosphate synthase [Epsilonproteobacteria bacterium]|nr:thiamine phosphate synthase [Campylobacterota bacterium]